MTELAKRLAAIRDEMSRLELDALVVPRADEYLGEYIPERNERMRWISGFTGSAGVVIVFQERAAIFVDGRYTVQVRKQVPDGLFEFHHFNEEPHIPWLAEQLQQGARVAYDSRMHPYSWQEEAEQTLAKSGVELVELERNLVDQCWRDRPSAITHQAILMPESLTGQSSLEKRQEIGTILGKKGAQAGLIFAADSCAWLLNIRGQDVPCLPVVLGYGLLHNDGRFQFFTDPAKLPENFEEHVGEGVEIYPESQMTEQFTQLSGQKVLAAPATANAWCQLNLIRVGAELIADDDPVVIPKACKNSTEVEGMRQAHIRDGVAMVRFLAWLDREVEQGCLHSEDELSRRLYDFRAEDDLFRGVSFDTISAAGGNAAMCHYNHVNFDEVSHLEPDTVYLVDSGGQYLDGTTDITRTISIGDPGAEVRKRFTLVLKGHIALDTVSFPLGTNGTQLDVLARQFLWQEGLDYDHGTGHGVGAFLSVHEGPQQISKRLNGYQLQSGMVISNEPGFYKDDTYGMRCENLVVVRDSESRQGEGPQMLGFEALTLAPFDTRLIDVALLTEVEKDWLNLYHTRVFETIAPSLNEDDRAWLKAATVYI